MLLVDRRPDPADRPTPASYRAGLAATTLLVALVAVGTLLALAQGGYHIDRWAPAGLVVLGLLGVLVITSPARVTIRRPWGWLGVTGIVAYAAWSAASTSWASDASVAWESAGQSLLYAGVVATAMLLARVPGVSFRVVLAACVAAAGGVAAYTLVMLRIDPTDLVYTGRLIGTVGYFNAEAIMLLAPLWSGIWIAADSTAARPLRVLALSVVTLAAATSLLAQSRGSIVALTVAGVVYLILVPRRGLHLALLASVVACTSLLIGPVNAMHEGFDPSSGRVPATLVTDAADRAWLAAALALILGAAIMAVESRFRQYPDHHHDIAARSRRPMGMAIGAAAATTLVVGALLLVGSGALERAAAQLRTPTISARSDESRLTNVSSNGRFELWHTSIEVLQLHPVRGVGAGSWEPSYYQLRDHAGAYVRQPHNLLLEAASERGLAGAALLVAFIGSVYGAARRPRTSMRSPAQRSMVAVLVATFTQWVVHAQFEWFWQLPAASWMAMLAAGMLLAMPWDAAPTSEPRQHHLAMRIGSAALVTIALVGIALPWLADRYVQQAQGLIEHDPRAAHRALQRAEALNPVSTDAARARVTLARAQHDPRAGVSAIHDYIHRAPDHWATYESVAMELDADGDHVMAQRFHELARQRNPHGFEFMQSG